ncbi:MAG: Synerg-CTERM sorting domain-containing protein [Synergistaceae bacterium]|nr:Synerg-CTERM sorting domain-containing protein [Synergistaceae bacterium]
MYNKFRKICSVLILAGVIFTSVSPAFAYGVYKADRNYFVGDRMTFAGFNWRVYKKDSTYGYITVTDYLDRIPFSNGRDEPDYAASDFRKRVNDYETQMRNYDGPHMSWQEADDKFNYIVKHDMKDVFKEDYDDVLFIMSLAEARAMGTSKLARDVLNLGDMWYLRTPGESNNGNACVVIKGGYISDFGTKAHIRQYVRPCLQVNLRSELFKPVYIFKSAFGAKEKIAVGEGFVIEDFDPSKGFKRTKTSDSIEKPINIIVRQRNKNSLGSCAKSYCLIEAPQETVLNGGIFEVDGETLKYETQPPKISYNSDAVRQGKADFVSVIAEENRNNGRYVSYAKISDLADVADGKGISVPFGRLPKGSYKLWIFADKIKDGEDECSQFAGGCVIENGAHGEKGYAVLGTDNVGKKFTVAPSGITLLFKNRVSYAQDFIVSKPGVIFTGLYEEGAKTAGADTAGGKIGGKLTVDGQTLKVNKMTLTSLQLKNKAVIDVCSDSILNQPGPHSGADDSLSGTLMLEQSGDFSIEEGSRIVVEHNCRVINGRNSPVTVWDNANQKAMTIPTGKTYIAVKDNPREPYDDDSQPIVWKTEVLDDEPVIPVNNPPAELSYKNKIAVQNSPKIANMIQTPSVEETEIFKAAEYAINMAAACLEYALYENPESIIGASGITEITEKTGFKLKITHAEGTGEDETLKVSVKLDVPIEPAKGKRLAVILPMKNDGEDSSDEGLFGADEETEEIKYGVFKADYDENTQIITFEIPEYGKYFLAGDEILPLLVTVAELNEDATFDGEKSSSSGGCNAGFGALALLGVLGVFYKKKK